MPETNIGAFWLGDGELAELSRQHPSTPWGTELMREVWPKKNPQLLSSETYRGYATVLSKLHSRMRRGLSISRIEQIIEDVDQSLKSLANFSAPTHASGGAVLAVANAWESAHCGITPDQIAVAYESELIFTAKLFCNARQREMAGETLP